MNGSNEQKQGDVPEGLQSVLVDVLGRLASQFPLMFSGKPGTGVANPAPSAPPSASPSVDPIPTEWDAAFNGSIPPAPVAAPSAPAQAMKAVTVEIPKDIADPDWECNVKISTEEWAIIEAHREKKYAAIAKIAEQQKKEDALNKGLMDILEVAVELYKACYVPYSEGREARFVRETKQFEIFCKLMGERYPKCEINHEGKVQLFRQVKDVIARAIYATEPAGEMPFWHTWRQ